jgi:acetyl-CoA acetyltransferase
VIHRDRPGCSPQFDGFAAAVTVFTAASATAVVTAGPASSTTCCARAAELLREAIENADPDYMD